MKYLNIKYLNIKYLNIKYNQIISEDTYSRIHDRANS